MVSKVLRDSLVYQWVARLKRTAQLVIGLLMIPTIGGFCTGAFAQQTPTDESLGFFEDLLRNPDDVRANLAYAQTLQAEGRVNEAREIYRKVLTLSPDNPTAMAALAAPVPQLAQTDYTFRTGGAIETNSARRDSNFEPYFDTIGFAELAAADLRQIGDITLQSNLDLYSNIHNRYSPGNISYFSADSGPVFDLRGNGKLRTAIGGEYVLQGQSPIEVYGARQFEFDSANTIFNYFPPHQLALQSVNLLVGYNSFRESASFRSGPVIRMTAPFLLNNSLPPSSVLLVTPGYVLNGAQQSSIVSPQPAHYNEVNLDFLSLTSLAQHRLGSSQVIGVLGVFLAGDAYNSASPAGSPDRRDFRIIPRVGLRLAEFLYPNLQLDLDYRYDRNFSNEFVESYRDNIFSLTFTSRF
jgi:tetratricopeptide (TPR) repeat protein